MAHMAFAISLFVLAMAWTVVAVIKGLGKDSTANDAVKWGVLWLVIAMVLAGSAESINILDMENTELRNGGIPQIAEIGKLQAQIKELEKAQLARDNEWRAAGLPAVMHVDASFLTYGPKDLGKSLRPCMWKTLRLEEYEEAECARLKKLGTVDAMIQIKIHPSLPPMFVER